MTPYEEGWRAAEAQQRFSDACPYLFKRSGCDHTTAGQMKFDLEWRPKMDMWFKGWKDYLDQHGLGFNFRPSRNKKDTALKNAGGG